MPSVLSWFARRRSDSTADNNPSDRYDYLPGTIQNDATKKNSRLSPFSGIDRDWIAFFIFGCINNLIYVVILSAAVDLVGAEVPKGVVLLADITPSLLIKMIAPYFVHKVPYNTRVTICAILSFSAVVLIALADTISLRMIGVMMASLSSGLGELTFLMLSSFYRLQMVSAWSSGTGGAGLLGALLFLALTSWIGLSITLTLGVVSVFPSLMLFAYFVLLRSPPLHGSRHHAAGYRPILSLSQTLSSNHGIEEEELLDSSTQGAPEHQHDHQPIANKSSGGPDAERDHSDSTTDGQTAPQPLQDNAPLSIVTEAPPLAPTPAAHSSIWNSAPSWEAPQQRIEPTSINTLLASTDPDDPGFVSPFRVSEVDDILSSTTRRIYKAQPDEAMTLKEKLTMARSLLLPFMVPLFLVYVAEYTMNQGVLPVILFPLDKTPFTHLRDHYVTYSAIYQLGVFISRSSASLIEITHLWIPSLLQLLTLLLATSQAILSTTDAAIPIPSIYFIFLLILWEGLLGGSTYVHTYIGISRNLEHDPKGKEFALGVVGVADGLGILLAGLASLWIEPALCRWQVVEKGVDLCLAMAS